MADQTDRSRDVVEFLEQQHEEIRMLFSEVNSTKGAERADAFACLVRLLAVHETAEEMVVHPQARLAEAGDPIVEIRLGEENVAKQMLADLEEMGVDAPGFDDALATFEATVLDHAEKEEAEEFPLLHEVHDESILEAMTTQLKLAESIAPTHPHPHGPESAIGNLVVGPFVSIVDRVKDALAS